MRYIEGTKVEQEARVRRENVNATLSELEADYNRCYAIVRKTYGYLEKLGLRAFNRISRYKWSFDKDPRGYGYVCVRFGASLLKKTLVKRSGTIKEEELYRWIENKDLVLEALDEAYKFIDGKIGELKLNMSEMKERLAPYEERADATGPLIDAVEKILDKKQ